MRSRAFLLEAHHTTHIEGTQLTLKDADDLLAGRAVPGADPDDARELLNYRDAFAFVGAYFNDGGPITERLILQIHRRLVAGRAWRVCGAGRVPARAELCHQRRNRRDDLHAAADRGRTHPHAGTGRVAEPSQQHPSRHRKWISAIPTGAHPPIPRRQWAHVPAAFDTLPLSRRLRLQAALHA